MNWRKGRLAETARWKGAVILGTRASSLHELAQGSFGRDGTLEACVPRVEVR